MACLCKNPDGTLADICNGTCSQKETLQGGVYDKHLNIDPIAMDRIEYIGILLASFINKIDAKFSRMEKLHDEKWSDGFREGFKEGYTLGRESY